MPFTTPRDGAVQRYETEQYRVSTASEICTGNGNAVTVSVGCNVLFPKRWKWSAPKETLQICFESRSHPTSPQKVIGPTCEPKMVLSCHGDDRWEVKVRSSYSHSIEVQEYESPAAT